MFDDFKTGVLGYLASMRTADGRHTYRYSAACALPTLYSSAYACMTLSLLGEMNRLAEDARADWAAYFDAFQREQDGLFYDPVVECERYANSDWWGARHLALHMISAYTCLDRRPRYPFRFLEKYYDRSFLEQWLGSHDWSKACSDVDDIDNKVMNIACLLQYQRDSWADGRAADAVEFMKSYLAERVDPAHGMWGSPDLSDPAQRSRTVQFAYHLLPAFFFDGEPIANAAGIIDNVLATQNALGGFGVRPNSSACEDIDSIDLLVRLAPLAPARDARIRPALTRAFRWVLCNQVSDRGFVFRLNQAMVYGHREMSSRRNEGAMFPTWFRCLSLAYLSRYFGLRGFVIAPCPGLSF